MGKEDSLCKKFMSDNEIFADAFNFLLYSGKQKIKPSDLKSMDTTAISVELKNNNLVTVQKNRDILKVLAAKRNAKTGFLIVVL